MKYVVPAGLVLVSLLVTGYFVYMATNRTLTQLEGTLLQIFALLAGIAGSFWFGRQSATRAAMEVVRPHARSAFRRVTSLYSGLARAAAIIEESRDFDSVEKYHVAFARLEELVSSQLATVDDALEDWRDLVPTEVSDARGEPFAPNPKQE